MPCDDLCTERRTIHTNCTVMFKAEADQLAGWSDGTCTAMCFDCDCSDTVHNIATFFVAEQLSSPLKWKRTRRGLAGGSRLEVLGSGGGRNWSIDLFLRCWGH